jgi:hypothetical protein
MHTCKVYGLLVQSDFCLQTDEGALIEAKDSPDVTVRLCSEAELEAGISQPNHFSGYLPQICQLEISETEILIFPEPEIDEQVLRSCILGSAFSVLLQLRGYLVLHASAVILQERAVAFIGFSGAGKSTTASAFLSCGYPVITDDVLAVQFSQGQPEAIPSYPVIKLLPDAVSALGQEGSDLPLLHRTSAKRIQTFDYDTLKPAYPLQKIYLLSKGDHHEIEPLAPRDSLLSLINQSRAVRNLVVPSAKKRHFEQCAVLAQTLGVSRLQRKPALTELQTIVRLVEDDLTR